MHVKFYGCIQQFILYSKSKIPHGIGLATVKKSAKCTHAGRKKTNMTKSKKSEILCRSLFMSQRLSLTIVTGIQEGSLMQCSTPEKPAFSLYQFPTPKQGFLPWIPYKTKGWCCCGQGGHIVPMFSLLFFSALN